MTAADPRAAADRGGADVKFMLLIYNNPAALEAMSADERDEVFADVDKIMAELNETGELLGGEALAPVHRTVRLRDGVPAVTDGPFAEAKEQLAGYLMVDCETIERAVEIAGRWPDAKRWAMEVRPLMTQSGAEM
jgi:hypothetical protein